MNEPLRDCPLEETGEEITLTFKMISSGPATRVDDSHAEEESEYLQLEDGIDYSDLGLFVFARMESKPESEEKLILKNTNLLSTINTDVYIDGAPGAYNVSLTILRTRLHEILFGEDSDGSINPNGTEKVLFRVLLVANSTSPGTDAQGKWNQITGTTFSEVIEQFKQWHYAMAYLYNELYEGNDLIELYSNKKKNIPMFGTNNFTVTQKALYYSRPEDQVFLGEMDLLRALAKVRVVDNISDKNVGGYPKISSCEFLGTQSEARQLPDNVNIYQNGQQVHSPNIFEPDKELNLEGHITYRLGIMPESMTTVPADQRKGSVFVGYVPEQTIGYINILEGTGMPVFRITVEMSANEKVSYDVPMTGYGSNTFDFGDYILRNHIYTLSVDKINGAEAKITATVEDWDEQDPLFLDYSETVGATGKLSWTPNTYQSKYEAEVTETGASGTTTIKNLITVMKDWRTTESGLSESIPLEGTFTIDSPVGATWTAYLLQTGGQDGGAFAFQEIDADGKFVYEEDDDEAGSMDGDDDEAEEMGGGLSGGDLSGGGQPLPVIKTPKLVNSVSGIISEGKTANLRIYTRQAKPTGNVANRAILQVLVTIKNGEMVSVFEAPVNPDGITNCIIVQNP